MSKPLAVITGASSGIGEVFARHLAPTHNLLLVARRADRLEALAAQLAAEHGNVASVFVADLTLDTDLAAVADHLAAEPDLAMLINNAGFGTRGLFWNSDLHTQEQMHRLHVMAPVRLTHAALRNMVAKNFGAVINVASVAAFARRPGATSYGATKNWMTAFTEGIYLELKSVNSTVKIQALCPGFTYSEFHDAMRADRRSMAPPWLWFTADFVVSDSLRSLARNKPIVVPGWPYKLIVAVLPRLPQFLRLRIGTKSSPKPRRSPSTQ